MGLWPFSVVLEKLSVVSAKVVGWIFKVGVLHQVINEGKRGKELACNGKSDNSLERKA